MEKVYKNTWLKYVLPLFMVSFMVSCSDSPSSYESDIVVSESDLSAQQKSSNTNTADGGAGVLIGYTEADCPDYGVYEYTLWAGKTNDAGTVEITNDGSNIYVNYKTNETADLGEVHVYVWDKLDDIPDKRPAPGKAPYTAEDINADSYTVTIPMESINCGDELYISTHAALVTDANDDGSGDNSNAGETAYAGGSNNPDGFDNAKGAWWGFVTYTVDCFYDISGTVYEDADNNGDLEDGETGFGEITVTLLDADGNEVATTTTNDDGSYLFEHVAGGSDYKVVSGTPDGDYDAKENKDGYTITNLDDCITKVDFGFVPLYDLSVVLNITGDNSCLDNTVITINGEKVSSLVNQLPGYEYTIVATAYDAEDGELAKEEVSGSLNGDTVLELTLSGWTCPGDDDGTGDDGAGDLPNAISNVVFTLGDGTTIKIDSYGGEIKDSSHPAQYIDYFESVTSQDVTGYVIKAGQGFYDQDGELTTDSDFNNVDYTVDQSYVDSDLNNKNATWYY